MRNVELLKLYESIVRGESALREGRDYCMCIAVIENCFIDTSWTSPQILDPLHMGGEFYLCCRKRI